MKQTKLLFTLISILVASSSFGQLYITLGSGYQSGALANNTVSEFTDQTTFVDSSQVSYGTGIPINLGLGLGLTDNWSVELEGEYLLGNTYQVFKNTNSTSGSTRIDEFNLENQIRLIPSLVYNTDGDGLGFYGKLGAIVPVGGTTEMSTAFSSSSTTLTYKVTDAFALGARLGAGVRLGLTDALSLNGGLEFNLLNITPTSASMTSYDVDGVDRIDTRTTFEREIKYLDSPNNDQRPASTTADTNQAQEQEIPDASSYSSLGFKISLKYTLGGNN